ncbi:MAG TPA: carboxypeptidase-like regulatory domain-containing protein [Myxococcaceae bacterium]|nr:carboxypeptidase-like regulatory domain-containing protein [Myxococcaceae bacterium]
MRHARQLLLVLGLAGPLAACDGGVRVDRRGNPCVDERVTLRVEVVDAQGVPVPGATVTATHLETGYTITGTTGERGVTTSVSVDPSLGAGPMRVVANAGPKVSEPARVEWTCDDCHCRPEPDTLRVQLHP